MKEERIRIGQLLQAAALCLTKESDRPFFRRVRCERKGGKLTIIATNGHVLFHARVPNEGVDREWFVSYQNALNGKMMGAAAKEDDKYPPWRRLKYLVKKNKTPEQKAAVQLRYLHLASRIGSTILGISDGQAAVIEKHGSLDPVMFTFADNIWLLVMPCAIHDDMNKKPRGRL